MSDVEPPSLSAALQCLMLQLLLAMCCPLTESWRASVRRRGRSIIVVDESAGSAAGYEAAGYDGCVLLSWSRRIYPFSQAPSGSAMRGLHVRRKVLPRRTIATEPRGDARATTGLCAFGVRRTKVLREKVHCRSLSSIHILYNQALVEGLSVSFDPATRIGNVQLDGGSMKWASADGPEPVSRALPHN